MYVDAPYRRPVLLFALAGVVALAWVTLAVWGASPYARYLDHSSLEGGAAVVPVALAGWLVMILAMMLPTSLPLVELFRRMTASRPDATRLVSLLVAGYLGAWLAFGAAAHAGDLVLHRLLGDATPPQALAAGVLGLAGVYQFTPLKRRCLSKCRSPRTFIASHWHGRDARREALALGAHHGLYCVGCCWSMMLVMFAVGAGSLGWMLGLGAVMAVEKNAPWGRRLSAPLGVGLLAVAGLTALAA